MSEDVANIELIDGIMARGGCCGQCYTHAIEFGFTEEGIRKITARAKASPCGCLAPDETQIRKKHEAMPIALGGPGILALANDLGLSKAETRR